MTSETKVLPAIAAKPPVDMGHNNDQEEITHFAPFETQKGSRSLFHKSSELESQCIVSESDSSSKEIEFQQSLSGQFSGNAVVLFRKLKAAVGGGGGVTTPFNTSPVEFPANRHTLDDSGSSGLTHSDYSAARSVSAVSSTLEHGRVDAELAMSSAVRENSSEEPRISLTSYSDAHRAKKAAASHQEVSGPIRTQVQAVNKTEMLKRFGSIADNKAQVSNGMGSARLLLYWCCMMMWYCCYAVLCTE